MRILWVKADKLLPVHSGGNIRTFGIVRELAAHQQLTFFSYYGGEPDPQYERDMRQHFPNAVCMCSGYGSPTAFGYLLHLLKSAPYAVSRFASSEVQARINDWFENKSFDVVVCDFLDAAVNFPTQLTIPTVLLQHNVESEIWRRHAETKASVPARWLYRLQHKRMLRFEDDTLQRFESILAVSDADRETIARRPRRR